MLSTDYAITLVGIGLVIAVFYFVIANSKEADPDYPSITKNGTVYAANGFFFCLY